MVSCTVNLYVCKFKFPLQCERIGIILIMFPFPFPVPFTLCLNRPLYGLHMVLWKCSYCTETDSATDVTGYCVHFIGLGVGLCHHSSDQCFKINMHTVKPEENRCCVNYYKENIPSFATCTHEPAYNDFHFATILRLCTVILMATQYIFQKNCFDRDNV